MKGRAFLLGCVSHSFSSLCRLCRRTLVFDRPLVACPASVSRFLSAGASVLCVSEQALLREACVDDGNTIWKLTQGSLGRAHNTNVSPKTEKKAQRPTGNPKTSSRAFRGAPLRREAA